MYLIVIPINNRKIEIVYKNLITQPNIIKIDGVPFL